MKKKSFKYIYGPVPSWRLGSSLGIDPLSARKKACSFDCIYCQIGKTEILTDKRKTFATVGDIIDELNSLPPVEIDYITFSGTGEPTLAKNLGKMVEAIKGIRKEKTAILTNSSLVDRKDVQKDLCLIDFVVAKLDAPTQNIFELINQPVKTARIKKIIKSMKGFKRLYPGRLALQIMFIQENKKHAKEIAQIAKEIKPDEVQLNTPLRPCRAKPLTKSEMEAIERYFGTLNTISVYNSRKKSVTPISTKNTLKRRGKV